MDYNERLLNECLQGNMDSLKELKYNAGTGNPISQYYLAQYYLKKSGTESNNEYTYWIEKAVRNGYNPDNIHIKGMETKTEKTEISNRTIEGFIWIIGGLLLTLATGGYLIFIGAIIFGLYILLFKRDNDEAKKIN